MKSKKGRALVISLSIVLVLAIAVVTAVQVKTHFLSAGELPQVLTLQP